MCNKVLVALDILLKWREGLKEGFSLSNMINVKIRMLLLKLDKVITYILSISRGIFARPLQLLYKYLAVTNLQCLL